MGKDKHKGKEKPAGLGSVPAAGKAKGPEALVPIGARMRATKRQRDEDEDEAVGGVALNDLDEQMAALERELEDSSDSEDDSSAEGSEGEEEEEGEEEGLQDPLLVKEGGVIKSRLAVEARIPPLPAHLLPLPECKGKGGGKASREAPPEDQDSTQRRSGLEATVMDMLRNYQPASLEKLPFYCRICRFQGASVEELSSHKKSELHRVGVEKERKLSYCKLCRKQFTSPEQLKGHLSGKPHQELLRKRMEDQGKAFVPRNGREDKGEEGGGKRVRFAEPRGRGGDTGDGGHKKKARRE